MNFSAWSIRNPVAPLLAFFLLMFMGIKSFYDLPITRFPNIDVPVVAITITQSGASPAELETQVTKEVEDAVASLEGVDAVNSNVTDGVSTTSILFTVETSTDRALQDVKDAVDRIRSSLPATADEPLIQKIDVEGQAIQTFAVSSANMSLEEISWFVDDTVKRALQGQPGVGKIERYGGVNREVHIELDPDKLNSFGITATQVNQQLLQTNTDVGSGRGQIAGKEQAIRTLGDARSIEELKNTTIALSSGRFVKLSDLGTVQDAYEEPSSFSRFNGTPVVSFGIFRSKGASEVDVAETVDEGLAKVRALHPDVKIELVNDLVYFTYGNYESAIHTLIEGALLAVIVVFLFLRNWRATLISAIALPLSAIPTFWIMDLMGFSLNLVSFLALTLATGILVDDAIVEIENIARHIRMGKTPYRAAIEAADEIGLAVIATTFTIIAVFAPVSFMGGIPGQYFIQFGLTVAISVFFSLAVARLITPMMAAYLMRGKDSHFEHDDSGSWLMRSYETVIRATSSTWKRRIPTVIGAFVFMMLSGALLMSVPGSFMPPEDTGRVTLSVELPPSASLEDTEKVVNEIYARIDDIDGIADIYILGGSSPKGDLERRRASVYALLDKKEHSLAKAIVNDILGNIPLVGAVIPRISDNGRTIPQWDIEAEVFARVSDIPDVRILKLNDRGERDITYNFTASNSEDLDKAAAILEADLRALPELELVAAEGALPRSEIRIVPDTERMARLGISTSTLASLVRVATIGDVDRQLPKISLDNRMIPIRVQLSLKVRKSLAELKAIRIPTSTGTTVPLSSIADVEYAEGPSKIKRYDRNRVISIGASLPRGVALDTATKAFDKVVAAADIPADVTPLESGDAKVQAEMVTSFLGAMALGVFLVLGVLILLFKDLFQPFSIILSLPLALAGVAIGLILTNNSLSMPVLIGILMLMGIVTKNAILLIDFAIEMMHQGMNRVEATLEAGRKRARPIIMTSIAMSAGMLPSALGVGEGGAFRAPMAIAVIGGIVVSTVMSLVVVPSIFLTMDDISRFFGWMFSRLIGKKDDEPDALDTEALSVAVSQTSKSIESLEERLQKLEGDRKGEQKSNVINISPLAAE